MLFHSYEFLFVFLPITWCIYAALLAKVGTRAALTWLVFASFVFYGWWNPLLLPLLCTSLIVNYGLARWIEAKRGSSIAATLLFLGLAFNIGLIVYYKYLGFLVSIWNQVADGHLQIPHVVLPLAISFFTFVEIAYLVDTWRGEVLDPGFLNFSLFVTFFPHLIAGPIVHHGDLLPQFMRQVRISRSRLAVGLSMFSIGLFKKLVIADHVGAYFEQAYPIIVGGAPLSLPETWLCMTDAALQIYFDYSGYSDMALGLALLFGIKLPLNFYSPFRATSIVEFWRRWNITLMRFLRNYIYIPLGGNRLGFGRQAAATLVTMLICGLWHGSGVNYLLWGLLVGSLLILSAQAAPLRASMRPSSAISKGFKRFLVFAAFVLPLSIFLFPSIHDGLRVFGSMLGLNGVALPLSFEAPLGALGRLLKSGGIEFRTSISFGPEQLEWTLLSLGVVFLLPNCQQMFGRFKPALLSTRLHEERGLFRWRPSPGWALIIAALFVSSVLFMVTVKEFFYFRF